LTCQTIGEIARVGNEDYNFGRREAMPRAENYPNISDAASFARAVTQIDRRF